MNKKKDDELRDFMEHAENEFFSMVDSGQDIRIFLYFPYELLSDRVKLHLDEFLYNEAYTNFENDPDEFEKNFVVYKDENLYITIDENVKRMELLDKINVHFLQKEEYEKCLKIKILIDKLKNKWIEKKF